MSPVHEFADRAVDPHVVGFLHTPETPNGNGLILTHGAGGNAQAPLLRAIADTFCESGFTVLRCNLPFRQVRAFGPPGPADAARDRAGLKNAVAALEKIIGSRDKGDAPLLADVARSGNSRTQKSELLHPVGEFDSPLTNAEKAIFLAGHSYGGRQASMLCAEEPGLVAGLLLLSYPLHPPRRPEQQRTQHLPDLHTSTLFVHGTRDPFGSIPELERAIKMIPAKTRLLAIDGAGHDLGFKGKGKNEALLAEVLAQFRILVGD